MQKIQLRSEYFSVFGKISAFYAVSFNEFFEMAFSYLVSRLIEKSRFVSHDAIQHFCPFGVHGRHVYSKLEDIQHYEFCASAKCELKTAQQRVNVTLYFVTEQC
ncbi:hypothetical protein Zmor_010823 [Zophobas morio]|uniref:Uncharacterized protein n=1 Tax=Zophobas morio TaxID=2755281 RepID=A0AA38IPS4_9CUCU|nr:hypothetical protein Zmor_010823 [Zophobas morio]